MKSAYEKYLMTWIYMMVVEMTLGLFAMYYSNWFVAPFFLVIFSGRYFFLKIKCPKCGTPVIYDNTPANLQIFALFFRPKCTNCGWDLKSPQL